MLLDFSKLPEWQIDIIKEINKYTLTAPDTMILMILNVKASQYLQIPRIKIISPEDNRSALCNYYGLLFSKSGSGKDRLTNIIDSFVFSGCKYVFNSMVKQYIEKQQEKIDEEIEDLKTNGAKDNYKLNNIPRRLSLSFSDGTPEGFIADREAYNIAGWGGTTFINSELVNYLKQKDRAKGYLLSLIGECFDKGNNSSKVIKGNAYCNSVDGVPSTLFASSSPSDIHKDNIFDSILESLNRQLARRSYICFPDDNEFKEVSESLDDIKNHFKENKNDFILETYNNNFKKIIQNLISKKNIEYKLSKDAEDEYFKYYIECNKKASLFNDFKYDGLISEILGRPWKMLKLAGILHSFKYNDYVQEISEGTINEAIYQTDFFGEYFMKFYKHESQDDLMVLYDYFVKNKNKEISKTQLRSLKIVNKNYFSRWFNDVYVELQDIASYKGHIIEEINGGRNANYYVLKDIV